MAQITIHLSFDGLEEAEVVMARLANIQTESMIDIIANEGGRRARETHEAMEASGPKRTRRTKAEIEAAQISENSSKGANVEGGHVDLSPGTTPGQDAGTRPAELPASTLTKEEAELKFKAEVRPALGKVMAVHGQDHARKFLADYQGREIDKAKISEVPVEQYDDFIAKCEAEAAKPKAA